MVIAAQLANKGFSLEDVSSNDLNEYLRIKKNCYKKYVDEYYDGWVDDVQIKMNNDIFAKTRSQSCFQKIMLDGEIVGFFGYEEFEDRIGGITIQMVKKLKPKVLAHFI